MSKNIYVLLILIIILAITHGCSSKYSQLRNGEKSSTISDCLVEQGEIFNTICINDGSINGCIFATSAFWPKDSAGKKILFEGKDSLNVEVNQIGKVEFLVDSIITRSGAIAFRCMDNDTVIKIDREKLKRYKRQYYGFINYGDTIINVVGLLEPDTCNYWARTYFQRRIASGYSMDSWHCSINLSNNIDSECYME